MKALKSLAPILILIAASIYFHQWKAEIPESILQGLRFLPVVLAILVIALAIHFNRSRVYFYSLLVLIASTLPILGWIDSALELALLSTLLPIQILLFTLFRERGIFSLSALPGYMSLLLSSLAALLIAVEQPQIANTILLSDWLPARYFDWTALSQTVLIIAVVVFIAMLVLCFLRPSPQISAGLGILLMLTLQLHFAEQSVNFDIYSTIALLMCLYAITQDSWRMAYLDELTGIPGRRALREKFQQLNGSYSIAMLDVDHFKKFNDTYGHDTGDSVLQMIAARVMQVGGGGLSYRYGGEEFAVVFKGKDVAATLNHLQALRESIAATPFVINRGSRRKSDKRAKVDKQKSVTVTVSIGVADSDNPIDGPWDALKLADKALYRAKKKGRNCVCK